MPKILLVDDDRELTDMLGEYLLGEDFEVTAVHDGESGVSEALSGRHDMVVLDKMLPRLSGIEALGLIRQSSNVPVLLLTARGDDVDRISGLDLGADDYVPKPCSPGELVARLRAIMRRVPSTRGGETVHEAITSGPLKLWPSLRKVEWKDKPLDLTGTEFNLLEELARNSGQIVGKEQLSFNALGRALTPFDRRIDVHISSIRHKLGPRQDGQPWILGVRGQGYQLVSD